MHMRLVVGGCGQGKLDWLRRHTGEAYGEAESVADGETCREEELYRCRVLCRFHCLVRRELLAGREPEQLIDRMVEKNPGIWIISDEIGSGIIPAERAEREYRERTGRLLCQLAARAQEVYRVVCGLGRKLKG